VKQFNDLLAESTQNFPEITHKMIDLMSQHWELIEIWNKRSNLTAITNVQEAVLLHYRDSLEALVLDICSPIIDIGSGAGFPGIPLAIARPNWQITLLEPRQKRASFLRTVKARLGLTNVRILDGRSDDQPVELFASAVSRATFSTIRDMEKCMRWLKPGGKMYLYRSEPTGISNRTTAQHMYQINATPRYLEIWSNFLKPDLSES